MCTGDSMPHRDLDYWAQTAPGRPGGRTVAGTRPLLRAGSLQARAVRPADSARAEERVAGRGADLETQAS